MSDMSLPVACSLTSADLNHRERAWRKLLASGLVLRERIPGGVRLSAAPRAAAALMKLIDLERECCGWIHFNVESDSAAALTAEGEGEEVLAVMFLAELPRSGGLDQAPGDPRPSPAR